jgi:hypothetical protein
MSEIFRDVIHESVRSLNLCWHEVMFKFSNEKRGSFAVHPKDEALRDGFYPVCFLWVRNFNIGIEEPADYHHCNHHE